MAGRTVRHNSESVQSCAVASHGTSRERTVTAPLAIAGIGLIGMVLGRALAVGATRGRATNAEEIKSKMIRAQQAQADAYKLLAQLRDQADQQNDKRLP